MHQITSPEDFPHEGADHLLLATVAVDIAGPLPFADVPQGFMALHVMVFWGIAVIFIEIVLWIINIDSTQIIHKGDKVVNVNQHPIIDEDVKIIFKGQEEGIDPTQGIGLVDAIHTVTWNIDI